MKYPVYRDVTCSDVTKRRVTPSLYLLHAPEKNDAPFHDVLLSHVPKIMYQSGVWVGRQTQ